MAETVEVTVSKWALGRMKQWAASNALTYVSHFGTDGLLNTREFNDMERWRKLSDDLNGDTFEPMDPAKGKIRDFDPTKVEDLD